MTKPPKARQLKYRLYLKTWVKQTDKLYNSVQDAYRVGLKLGFSRLDIHVTPEVEIEGPKE